MFLFVPFCPFSKCPFSGGVSGEVGCEGLKVLSVPFRNVPFPGMGLKRLAEVWGGIWGGWLGFEGSDWGLGHLAAELICFGLGFGRPMRSGLETWFAQHVGRFGGSGLQRCQSASQAAVCGTKVQIMNHGVAEGHRFGCKGNAGGLLRTAMPPVMRLWGRSGGLKGLRIGSTLSQPRGEARSLPGAKADSVRAVRYKPAFT
jgi:hypothetical protein